MSTRRAIRADGVGAGAGPAEAELTEFTVRAPREFSGFASAPFAPPTTPATHDIAGRGGQEPLLEAAIDARIEPGLHHRSAGGRRLGWGESDT